MRKKLNRCNFPTFLPAPQIFLFALFSLHYQNLGGFGGVFKVMERRKYIITSPNITFVRVGYEVVAFDFVIITVLPPQGVNAHMSLAAPG